MKPSFFNPIRALVLCCILVAGLITPITSFSQANLCGGATTITPGNTCTNTNGTIVGASYTAIGSSCTTRPDVWYAFTATAASMSVTLSAAHADTRFQIYTAASCGGTVTSVFCSSGLTGTVTGLNISSAYLIRIYNTTTTNTFSLCMVNIPPNDLCTNAIAINSAVACSNTNGFLSTATTYTADAQIDICNPNDNDIWYSFVANSTGVTITVGGAANRAQLFNGTCGALTSLNCGTGTALTQRNLVPGTTYYVRVLNTGTTTGATTICIQEIAGNDNCTNATIITSGTTCVNTTSSMYLATNSGVVPNPTCAGTTVSDVWFRFTASTVNPTITLSSIGAGFLNPNMELFSMGNSACVDYVSQYCGTTSIAANHLTVGSNYYVRVYSSAGAAATSGLAGRFNICVVDPVTTTPPFNDECSNAINLPVWNTCNKIGGNMAAATASSTSIAPCTGPVVYDTWFKFTSTNTTANITLSDMGANFTGQGLQLFQGTCGALVPTSFCGTTTLAATGLTAGAIYYVRVFSNAGTIPNGNARFNICVTTSNAPLRFGNSYVNLSKKNTGGVVEKGDTLEIRMTISHTVASTMYALRYVDNIPSNTAMMALPADSIRIITNEGLTFRRYTPLASDDAATYKPSPLAAGEYNIRMNLAFGTSTAANPSNTTATEAATATGTMTVVNSSTYDKPKGGSGVLFATAYRVKVTGNPGDTIKLHAGQFLYRTSLAGSDISLTSTPYNIVISNPLSLCANSIGVNSANEFGGTFGSGTTVNRPTDLTQPIAGYSFISDMNAYNGVGDGRYAIVKNLSPRSSVNTVARRKNNCDSPSPLMPNDLSNCTARMFGGFWYISGDHTGTSNATGNAPPAATAPGGYMLMVNADYVASEAYRQTVSNLCPNTYYEFSAWFKNICPACGIDSSGTSLYNPGVKPNLSFSLNDVDYYSTGEIDTVGWIKKGFVFVTGPSQTSATFSIRNNSQGGGGNDWAMDDIAIATCLPNMDYSPTLNPMICEGNAFEIRDTIRSYFNNYRHHQWQRSTNGGSTWVDLGVARDSTPVYNASRGAWEYVTRYTIPPAFSTPANDGDLYRVLVATTSTNLGNPDCRVTDGISFISVDVIVCGPVLSTELLSFNGKLVNGNATLNWTTSKEEEPISFMIDRSQDGINFQTIATVNSHNDFTSFMNSYTFTDPTPLTGKWKYRIVMSSRNSSKKYSRIIQLNNEGNTPFAMVNVINPFMNTLDFEISMAQDGKVEAELLNMNGRVVKKQTFNASGGNNSLSLSHTESLPAGMYILQVRNNDEVVARKVLKKNNQ